MQLARSIVGIVLENCTFAVENVEAFFGDGDGVPVYGGELAYVFDGVCDFLIGRIVRLVKERVACGILIPHAIGIDL